MATLKKKQRAKGRMQAKELSTEYSMLESTASVGRERGENWDELVVRGSRGAIRGQEPAVGKEQTTFGCKGMGVRPTENAKFRNEPGQT